jgi:hypothetical protein
MSLEQFNERIHAIDEQIARLQAERERLFRLPAEAFACCEHASADGAHCPVHGDRDGATA